ncbi:hypothetical protein [Occultella gossypii]|uniref:DUF4352 domain-containing protein n=1 Tax=Occultella gossypii TaxID=2800820 RepID=A0ABS7S2R9_9MICO|nr:hypothetical protein [Occultella gossypii]MBZ2194602.1 hypothetical protein [Occultella gossypii]
MASQPPDRSFAPPYPPHRPTVTGSYPAGNRASYPAGYPTGNQSGYPTVPQAGWPYAQTGPAPSGGPAATWPPAPPARSRVLVWLVPSLVGVLALVVGFAAGALTAPFGGPLAVAWESGNTTSREQPAALGTSVTILDEGYEWDVTLGTPEYDADDLVRDVDPLNDPAPDGQAYVVVPVTATYHGPDRANAGLDLWVSFVTAQGNSYDEASLYTADGYLMGPDPLYLTADVFDGATVTGNVTFAIPEGAQDEPGAVWLVADAWTGDGAFFEAH